MKRVEKLAWEHGKTNSNGLIAYEAGYAQAVQDAESIAEEHEDHTIGTCPGAILREVRALREVEGVSPDLRTLCQDLIAAEHIPAVTEAVAKIRDFLEKNPG